tara:strand:- start:113 stop:667 length:555 start_codon:yes stop_codon:yes gene_type:complete
MADYSKRTDKNGKVKLEPLNPQEAIEYLARKKEEEEGAAPSKDVEATNPTDKAAKEAQLLGSTKEAIQLRMAEIKGELLLRKAELKGQIDVIKATESAKEKAGKHLAVFGAAYLCLCVVFFLGVMSMLPSGESVAVAATLITLVVTQLASILKTVVDHKEQKNPTELMHDIVQQQLENDHEKEN